MTSPDYCAFCRDQFSWLDDTSGAALWHIWEESEPLPGAQCGYLDEKLATSERCDVERTFICKRSDVNVFFVLNVVKICMAIILIQSGISQKT